MTTSSRVRTAGVIGMVGGALWIISIITQYSLGLFEPDGSPLRVIHELIALAGMSGAMIGFLGLLWGQAFRGRLGSWGVVIYVLGYGLIIIGGLVLLVIGPAESPIFLLFPIGGNLSNLGYILMGIATVTGSRWQGWQRWMPLAAAVVAILTMGLPMLFGVTPDGPGMIPELLQGVLWIGVGLAVFTASRQPVPTPAPSVQAV